VIALDSFVREVVVGKGILTDEQYTRVVRSVYQGAYSIPAVPDALAYVPWLLRDGHSLRVVTNRSEAHQNLRCACEWLRDHSLNLPIIGVVYGNSKASACRGLDVFVDDDPNKLAELDGIVKHRLLLRWPHTKHQSAPPGVVELHSWREIYSYIQGGIQS
jgi:hypothetical protein